MKFIKTDLAKKLEQQYIVSFTPTKGTEGSNGFDLRACVEEPVTILVGEVVKIPTGVKVWNGSADLVRDIRLYETPYRLAGLLLPRSSTAGAILNNTVGLCDESYQGEIFVKLRNITDVPITIHPAEAFVQLVFTLTYDPTLAESFEQVDNFKVVTERGEGGFGSTNHNQDDLLGR